MLKQALVDIHKKSCSKLSFEELYRASYKIVLKKKGAILYDRVKEFEEQWFANNVIPHIQKLVTSSLINIGVDRQGSSVNQRRQTGEEFLKGMRDCWEDHNTSMNMMADILMYLDRGYTQMEPNRVSIFTTTIALFRDHILRSCLSDKTSNQVIDILTSVMLDQINMEREGDVIDRTLIRSCSRLLSSLYETEEEAEHEKLYLTVFEPRFLRSSAEFYTAECDRLLREAEASVWLRYTSRRLTEEVDRCGTTIELETLPKVSKVIDEKLITAHLEDFINLEGSGLKWMIDSDKIEELAILYRLIARVDEKKDALRTRLQTRVVELGLEIEQVIKSTDFSVGPQDGEEQTAEGDKPKPLNAAAQQTAAAIKWVEDVLRLKDKFDTLLTQCFQDDLIIQSALTKSFSDFINMFTRCSEYVSLFIDDSLKRGMKGRTEAEIEALLEKAIVLTRYLQDRDMFQTYYQRHLARRLLNGKYENDEIEKQIISRMKQEMGQQFTSKFEGMFRDLVMSSELTTNYRDKQKVQGASSPDLAISVLTTNYWPADAMGRTAHIGEGSGSNLTYPRDIERLQQSFEQFYLKDRSGRKLTWIATTGSADLACTFPAIEGKTGVLAKPRNYILTVSTHGMVVLLLFNELGDDEGLTFEEILEKTNIPTSDLSKTLSSISVPPKARVLLKDPMTKSAKPGDKFTFNKGFQSKIFKIKAPLVSAVSRVEDSKERKKTEEKNTQERSHIIDAAIVRIMK